MSPLPYLGVGVGLRREHFASLPATARPLDWVEVTPETFVGVGGRARQALLACRARWPIVPHGVSLDVGGPDPLDDAYLDGLRRLCDEVDAPYFSDHLSFCRLGGVYLYDLLPLPMNEAAVAHVAPRIRAAAARVGRPFLLENPTYYEVMPGSTLDEATFLARVVEAADCGLLLDLNNVHVNALNHGYDPVAFLDALPLERVGQVHLAGHDVRPGVVLDTHRGPVPDPVWRLYERLLARTGPVTTLIEWDTAVPADPGPLLDEADRARALLATTVTRRAARPGAP